MKAVSLFSGGLDSQLAICIIKEQAIEVVAVNFITPFFGADERCRLAAKQLQVAYHEIELGHAYLEVLKNPVYGYGKHLNPCIDCHAFMLKNALSFMEQIGASFIITGEVLGQRPMSQNRTSLQAVEKLSGCKGLVLRPLSARLLAPTIPEIEGWVDRDQLLDISGRSRARQIELAGKYGIKDYPTPAGGCLLTQESFSNRLRRLLAVNPEAKLGEMEILKVGRHFYIGEGVLLVVGRNHSENERLNSLAREDDYLLKVMDRPGPLGLVRGFKPAAAVNLELAAGIVGRYSDARELPEASIVVSPPGQEQVSYLSVQPLQPDQIPPAV